MTNHPPKNHNVTFPVVHGDVRSPGKSEEEQKDKIVGSRLWKPTLSMIAKSRNPSCFRAHMEHEIQREQQQACILNSSSPSETFSPKNAKTLHFNVLEKEPKRHRKLELVKTSYFADKMRQEDIGNGIMQEKNALKSFSKDPDKTNYLEVDIVEQALNDTKYLREEILYV